MCDAQCDAQALRAEAWEGHTSTRASGTNKVVLARYASNRRLGDALQQWAFCSMRGSPGATAYYEAFCSMRGSPGATAYYERLRARNIGHHAALRQLTNRLVGNLHGCLKTHTTYDENTAGGTSSTPSLDTRRTWDVCRWSRAQLLRAVRPGQDVLA